uniref:Uncharacterized protein n=1 Tax=Timema douglasi TaxID=61478 RepID=A0A7R8VMF6_TIMDO|nr:unnamed protein product [Timema douglasi]
MGNRNVSASPAPPEAPASGEVKKLKACCACPETKRARDECNRLAFCCIPGYTGLSGNKLADQAAKVVLVHLPPVCKSCDAESIGLTTGSLRQRMNNHRFDTNHKDPDKPVPIHAGTHN